MVRAVDITYGDHRGFLEYLFNVGVDRCRPREVLPPVLPKDAPAGRNIVLGAGKAAAEMAAVANEHLVGRTAGLVVTRYGHSSDSSTGNIEVIEAGHPVPDSQSSAAAERMLELAASATSEDRVLFMISGGGSALLCAPIEGVTPERKQEITWFLLRSGASIDEINHVRKHLSRIKGGALAHRAAAAELLTFAISDVVGDSLTDIASGPSVPFERDVNKAIGVLEKYRYANVGEISGAMLRAADIQPPTHSATVVATAKAALEAIAAEAEAAGWNTVLLGDDVEGDATEVGRAHADLALQYRAKCGRFALISGGELTVEVKNLNGQGGPNLEYLASLMVHLGGAASIEAIACDSDGIDGSEDNAGGYVSPTSLARAAQMDIDPLYLLRNNQTYNCFENLGDLIVTGPTRTNVNDIRIILVDAGAGTNISA